MEKFEWVKSQKSMRLKDLLEKNFLFPVSAIDDNLDVVEVVGSLSKVIGSCRFHVRELNELVAPQENECYYLCDNHALFVTLLFCLQLFEKQLSHYPCIEYINSISTNNDGFIVVDHAKRFSEGRWYDRIQRDMAAFFEQEDKMLDFVGSDDIKKKLKKSKEDLLTLFESEVTIDWEEAVYTGKKLELHFNGDMTIEEFNKAFCATFNAIPEMLDDKRYPYPSNFKLSRLGIEGDQVFSLPSHAMVFRFIREFKKKYGIYTELKYATRQWTHIDSTVAFSDFHRLPSLWYSIKEAILYKIAIKLYRS